MVQASARILGQWLLSQSEACGVGCHGKRPQCSGSHLGASAFSFPIGMNQIDPLDCNLNTLNYQRNSLSTFTGGRPPTGPQKLPLEFPPNAWWPLLVVGSPWKGAVVQMCLGAS